MYVDHSPAVPAHAALQGAAGGGSGPRALLRRAGAPPARAAVGGLLVAVATVALFTLGTRGAGPPSTPVVVARADLPPGTVLRAADLTTRPLAVPDDLAGHVFADPGPLVGAVTLGPVATGELIQAASVVQATGAPDLLEVAVRLDMPAALAGRLVPGERVDVLGTYGTGGSAATLALARRAVVGRVADDGDGLGGGGLVVTLGLADPGEAAAVAHAARAGAITLVRTTGHTGAAAPERYVPPIEGEPTGA